MQYIYITLSIYVQTLTTLLYWWVTLITMKMIQVTTKHANIFTFLILLVFLYTIFQNLWIFCQWHYCLLIWNYIGSFCNQHEVTNHQAHIRRLGPLIFNHLDRMSLYVEWHSHPVMTNMCWLMNIHLDMREIHDKHATQKQNIITIRPNREWFNDDILHKNMSIVNWKDIGVNQNYLWIISCMFINATKWILCVMRLVGHIIRQLSLKIHKSKRHFTNCQIS